MEEMWRNIPAELKSRPQWVVRRVKMPVNPRTGKGAKAGVKDTWGSWEEAVAAYEASLQTDRPYDGIGFEFDNNGLVGIDLDHVVDAETGELSAAAWEVVRALSTYTEISPSGTGLHLIAYGDIPDDGRQADIVKDGHGKVLVKYEIYKAGRYLTMTGSVLPGYEAIGQRKEEVRAFFQKHFPDRSEGVCTAAMGGFDDGKDLDRGLNRDKKLIALWNGERRHGNESSDDIALMNKLAFWCNCDLDLMVEAFRRSPYCRGKDEAHRKKADRTDYLPRTARAAIAKCGKTARQSHEEYEERRSRAAGPDSCYTAVQEEKSFSAALYRASRLEKPSWIREDEKKDKSTGETYKVRTIVRTELARFIRENIPLVFAKEPGASAVLIYMYDKGYYQYLDDLGLKARIRRFIPDPLFRSPDVAEIFQDLITSDKTVKISELNADENIINFQNGILHLDTMELTPHSPKILSTIQIPCNWNPSAKLREDSVFQMYLTDLSEGDGTVQEILLEAMGLCLSNVYGYRTKKSLFLVGKGDSGKTQIKELMARLLGGENVSASSLKNLCERFGTFDIYQKRLVGSNDMSRRMIEDMEIFKQLTGGDRVNVEPKGKASFTYIFTGFCWFNCNDLPHFGGDRGKHVYNRILPVYCNNVIPPEKRDPMLADKMMKEKEAIVVCAVKALKRLIARSYRFPESEKIQSYRRDYEVDNSSVLTFLEDCCERVRVDPDHRLKRSAFKEAYRAWCRANNRPAVSDREIGKMVKEAGIREVKTNGYWAYADIRFTLDFRAEYRFYDGTADIQPHSRADAAGQAQGVPGASARA